MKNLKAICTAVVLALALSLPAYGGEILSPGVATPPPPPPESNIVVEMSASTETSSLDQDTVSTPDVTDIFWLLASIF